MKYIKLKESIKLFINMMKHIDEPYKTELLKILELNISKDDVLAKLKLYVLSEPYFKQFHSEPAWLAYELVRTYLK